MRTLGTLLRGLAYASVFVGLLLVALPARILQGAGVRPPAETGPAQVLGIVVAVVGAALALACVVTFAAAGRGTPAPFDPPRRLVRSGPYAWVRNPMYIGAITALAGAALYYTSAALLTFALAFAAAAHAFIVLYEEPALGRLFGDDYADYRRAVPRWIPRPP
jgi:protein-S-isoprenylcysteine O-methyltransferase Ste14